MGITVHYRGSLDDLDRVEDFEDRVLDLALSLGGEARIWRSMADDQAGRVVRGVMLDLYPGQETISLLISPEGWLTIPSIPDRYRDPALVPAARAAEC